MLCWCPSRPIRSHVPIASRNLSAMPVWDASRDPHALRVNTRPGGALVCEVGAIVTDTTHGPQHSVPGVVLLVTETNPDDDYSNQCVVGKRGRLRSPRFNASRLACGCQRASRL